MRRVLPFVLLILATAALAEELTPSAIISALHLGATPEAIIAQINNPANTVAPITATDIANLRAANVPEAVIQALAAKAPVPTPTPAPPQPDNPKLVDLAKMVKAGLSEPIILEQLKRSGETYSLTANDLVYLKAAGVPESIITYIVTNKNAPAAQSPAAMGAPGAAPAPVTPAAPAAVPAVAQLAAPAEPQEVTVEGLVLFKPTFLAKNRNGRLVFKGDEVKWIDAIDPKENFSFHMSGVEKAWFSCQARPTESFCFQLNLQIVKGARYRFRDVNQESGSNEALKQAEEWIKKQFPSVPWSAPDTSN